VIEAASDAGQRCFGENRIQEAIAKIPAVRVQGLVWHLIGHLQSNKARRAAELFDVIQSVDSEKLATKISRCCMELKKNMAVLVQINIGEEPQKTGFLPAEVKEAVGVVDGLPNLNLLGLMCIPPFHQDPEETRPYFTQMADLLTEINSNRAEPMSELSMGMSADYRIAIEEGSTIIRVGTAIFGPRGR
jgi:hypothetical protein